MTIKELREVIKGLPSNDRVMFAGRIMIIIDRDGRTKLTVHETKGIVPND